MHPIPYGQHHITPEDIQAVVETLQSGFLTQGPKIAEFEALFANYIGCKYAVAVANGTAALHLSALALGVDAQSNVITTPITFAASANCVQYCGGTVWFGDIDPATGILSLLKVRELLQSKPKGFFTGIIPVDFAGYPVDMEAFRELADEYNLWLLEDACHAPGGNFTDSKKEVQHCGNGRYADLAIFSFHPVKHIATGEGGMITTNNKEFYQKLLLLRSHGITKDAHYLQENHGGWYYEMQQLGFNYRMPDLLCALGITQLKRANAGLDRRQAIADKYIAAFGHIPEIKLLIPAAHLNKTGTHLTHAYHLFIILIEDRKELYDFLRAQNIFAQVHYIPVHTMPYYQELGFKEGDFPLAEYYYKHCLSLPMFPSLKNNEQQYVIDQVVYFIKNKR